MTIRDSEIKRNAIVNLLQEKIEEMKLINFEISGSSMYPYLKAGDRVLVEHIDPGELRFGDIVTYRINNDLCSHRFIYMIKKTGSILGIVTKGDNIADFDQHLILPSQILGKIITVERKSVEINLQHPVWQGVNSLIATLSFFQGSLIKSFRYFKNTLFKESFKFPFKRIAAFPFTILLECITNLIYLTNALFSKSKRG